MKLTGKLKETVEEATTREEAKEATEETCMLLTDEEMEMVSVGEGHNLLDPNDSGTVISPIHRIVQ